MGALGCGAVVWHVEIDPAASRVLAARWPGVPNLGDITGVDWRDVPEVDWLTAGYPCTPFSLAGRREGTDDERHLWPFALQGIRHLRPRFVLLENVASHLRIGFDRVINGLAALGYVGSWACVRASDVGAPHRRERLFVVAADASRFRHRDTRAGGWAGIPAGAVTGVAGAAGEGAEAADPVRGLGLLPTPTASPYGFNQSPSPGAAVRPSLESLAHLLPTPQARDGKGVPSDDFNMSNLARAVTLLPTPRASDGDKGSPNQHGSSGDLMLSSAVQASRWGSYGAAIAAWERVLGRPAPPAVQRWPGGVDVLAPRFVEWLMGLDDGWVTRAARLTRREALRILGGGVVPQQGAHAVRLLLPRLREVLA